VTKIVDRYRHTITAVGARCRAFPCPAMMVQATQDWAGHDMQVCRKPMPVYV
jgi:hypothetical protein